MGGGFLAQGIRWARRDADGAVAILGRDGACRSAADGELAWAWVDWSDDHRVWNGRAEEAIHSEDSERGRNMVPGILGAECGFGPSSAADGSAAGRRPLCRQRAESVDELRLDRELV